MQVDLAETQHFSADKKQKHCCYSGGTQDLHSDFTHFSPQGADVDKLLRVEDGGER